MATTKITLKKNGPALVQGEFELVDPEGRPYDLGGRNVIAICRCGASGKKPLCDGAHNACGFEHDPVAGGLD